MSCIAGIFHSDGAPLDRAVLDSMLERMQKRAPDGVQAICEGPIAMGQAFLQTGSSGAERANQLTLDGKVFITADARIDDRESLLSSLRKRGRPVEQNAPHAELILHAYEAFGENFLDHLIGDFAFAIWDTRTAKLICARDHFGVRPFYYCQKAGVFAFASDIGALLAHPAVSDDLDEIGVADFLMFGVCSEADRTMYKDIRCLPPASRCVFQATRFVHGRYWQIPERGETRYSTPAAYVEHFGEVFERAVIDRLPDGPVALQLSGGMDSPSIAAVAARRAASSGFTTTAYHASRQSMFPDDTETGFARAVANHLGIPFVVQDFGGYPLFSSDQHASMRTSIPAPTGLPAHLDTLTRIQASGARVLLSGYAADAVLAPSFDYYTHLLRSGQSFKLCRELAHHVLHTKSLSGTGLRSAFRSGSGKLPPWIPVQPGWVCEGPGRETRSLATRWQAWWAEYAAASDARQQLRASWIQRQFETMECLPLPIAMRFPFLDLRVIECALAMPNFMLARKRILRDAMAGQLPKSVLQRPKTVPVGNTAHRMVTNGKLSASMSVEHAMLPRFVDKALFASAWQAYLSTDSESTWTTDLMLQPIAFGMWLSNRSENER